MKKQITKSDSDDRKQEQRLASVFLDVNSLPTPLSRSQCVAYKDEILICGDELTRDCYSYHTIKKQYKRVCSYPKDISLQGHCVVKLVNSSNSNTLTVLSFGGCKHGKRHTLVMQYMSVWSEGHVIEKTSHKNEWMVWTDKHNKAIAIGKEGEDYQGARAIIGGSNHHLLFITYRPKNIDVFDLTTFQYVSSSNLPIYACTGYHCFVEKPKNEFAKDTRLNTMLLFYRDTGLFISYDEDYNNFEFQDVPVCTSLAPLNRYAYVTINDCVLFFGGYGGYVIGYSNAVHMYAMTTNQWMKLEHILPAPLGGCTGVLRADGTFVHIVGGTGGSDMNTTNMHLEASVMQLRDAMQALHKKVKEKQSNDSEKKSEEVTQNRGSNRNKVLFFFFFLVGGKK
ncbi:hypothetical protein RFI_30089 [Reticulomyxa filosa]|uniref:Kelch motif family protein n=1 Tax=Reticulomyxa filosa TaxID=46433 RepID=X6M120_RETFI|nr:hypothetical protein RFI_30089 [Reticulomyxa filosa]|eukprot:ETO07301.1 hypothetical protein RFI_30089 [Reticulomyxa filosa]